MDQLVFIRRRNVLIQVYADGSQLPYRHCDSISQAKKLSRELQAKGGKVTVDHDAEPKPAPKRDKGDAADRFIARKLREEQAAKVAAERARKQGPNTISLSKSQEKRLKVQQA